VSGHTDEADLELSVKEMCAEFVNKLKMRFGEETVHDGTFTGATTNGEPETLKRM
jgi:hypothetical protein